MWANDQSQSTPRLYDWDCNVVAKPDYCSLTGLICYGNINREQLETMSEGRMHSDAFYKVGLKNALDDLEIYTAICRLYSYSG